MKKKPRSSSGLLAIVSSVCWLDDDGDDWADFELLEVVLTPETCATALALRRAYAATAAAASAGLPRLRSMQFEWPYPVGELAGNPIGAHRLVRWLNSHPDVVHTGAGLVDAAGASLLTVTDAYAITRDRPPKFERRVQPGEPPGMTPYRADIDADGICWTACEHASARVAWSVFEAPEPAKKGEE